MEKLLKIEKDNRRFLCVLTAVNAEMSYHCSSYEWYITDETPISKISILKNRFIKSYHYDENLFEDIENPLYKTHRLKSEHNVMYSFDEKFAKNYKGNYLYCRYYSKDGENHMTEKIYITDEISQLLGMNQFTKILFGKKLYVFSGKSHSFYANEDNLVNSEMNKRKD